MLEPLSPLRPLNPLSSVRMRPAAIRLFSGDQKPFVPFVSFVVPRLP
jgi:hypothetical protein